MVDESDAGHGSSDPTAGQHDAAGASPTAKALLEHDAVLALGSGISSQAVADFVSKIGELTTARILGIGQDQYEDDEGQRFEGYSLVREYSELLDELADAVAYVSFIAIKAGAVVRALDLAGSAIEAAAEQLAILANEAEAAE